jgi:hypothetical protein
LQPAKQPAAASATHVCRQVGRRLWGLTRQNTLFFIGRRYGSYRATKLGPDRTKQLRKFKQALQLKLCFENEKVESQNLHLPNCQLKNYMKLLVIRFNAGAWVAAGCTNAAIR